MTYVGGSKTLQLTFQLDSTNVTPSAATFKLEQPDGTLTTPNGSLADMTETATGVYRYTIPGAVLTSAGTWRYSVSATYSDGNTQVVVGEFLVEATGVG